MTTSIHEFTVKAIDGKDKALSDYKGNVLLVVNVASECGYTPQYKGLEELQKKYAARGLKVLGFPSNDFGAQEPGTEEQIQSFCTTNYGVTFDMFAKVKVLGDNAHPLYQWLQNGDSNAKLAGPVKWNFTKFLFDKDGHLIGRFLHKVEPTSAEVTSAIEAAL